MDAFALRDRVIQDYADYVQSFLRIRDAKIERFVSERLADGVLWPESLVQLSPAFQSGPAVQALVDEGRLHPLCARIFKDLRLRQHQLDALDAALRGENYLLTTGTSSGKSLTYLIPIFDHILKHRPETGKVRAIIVYPLNALINSQEKAIENYFKNLSGEPPIRVKRYTGQENDPTKESIRQDPPHVLLTNYVMLELMLTRPDERPFVERGLSDLQFLVMDELHTYRGRQGADVALLIRRLGERCGNPNLLCIGTSATLATGGSPEERKEQAAQITSKIFGAEFKPENVIGETLQRFTEMETPPEASLRAVVKAGIHEGATWDDLIRNPLIGWIENAFGLREEDGQLFRRDPIKLKEGATRLAEATGLDQMLCEARLREAFAIGSHVTKTPNGLPLFAFKLHQFISQGGAVYATAELGERRYLTLEGQVYAPGEGGGKMLFPLVFCRECGQEYYQAQWLEDAKAVLPVPPFATPDDLEPGAIEGYLALDEEAMWDEGRSDDLPDGWFNISRKGRTPKPDFRNSVPRRLYVQPDGHVAFEAEAGAQAMWFTAKPFMVCMRCGVVYTRRDKQEFKKLARLSSEGRSTATTLLSISTIAQMRREASLPETARKLLSFTDNRQDASLQAGHFNDFVEVALLRAALYKALQEKKTLTAEVIAREVVAALALDQSAYAKEPSRAPGVARRNEELLRTLVEYRLYEDLRRGWRVNQPNLEQAGLLKIEFLLLRDAVENEAYWAGHPVLAPATPETRYRALHAMLDYMRRELALNADLLDLDLQDINRRKIREALREPWTFDENEKLHAATRFVMPGENGRAEGDDESSLGPRSTLGLFLRDKATWPGLSAKLTEAEYNVLLSVIVAALRDGGLLTQIESASGGQAVQVRVSALQWTLGDGTPPPPDPIRSRWLRSARGDRQRIANRFFHAFYSRPAETLRGMEGHEHTGQVSHDNREKREQDFRNGKLAALFCSPTMELGIDIADLNAVHLRNVPPGPANYAQRSGRAGRSGQPALVLAYCAAGSPHDQHFYRRPQKMVSGAVAPPRLDLGNEELIKAHLHALWLARTQVRLGRAVSENLDMANAAARYPLREEIMARFELSAASQEELLAEAQAVLASAGDDLRRCSWYTPDWLKRTLLNAPTDFDAAFDNWRDLYAAAERQYAEAEAVIRDQYLRKIPKDEVKEAERRRREALRQKDLLTCNDTRREESDFYPYRYLAGQGFLPGYNFPRLPVRAFVPTQGDNGEFIARPRFLALNEFGPGNIIYHEGHKYRVTRSLLPPGEADSRYLRAKLCLRCGYFHEGPDYGSDHCQNCGTRLEGDDVDIVLYLFRMTAVDTQRVERITSDEEERRREGFAITTHYRLSERVMAEAVTADGGPLARLSYGPAATLWRINHKWKRSLETGYVFDEAKGHWGRRADSEDDNGPDVDARRSQSGVRLMVNDTRNVMLLYPPDSVKQDPSAVISLAYALKRGIEYVFQIEEQELAVELIGKEEQLAVMFWEAAEGGAGVLTRLAEDGGALAEVAKATLTICHFDESGNDTDADECARACYDCLLSYSNQPEHKHLNRHKIRDYLLQLGGGMTRLAHGQRDYEAHYRWLREQTDPASELERKFLDHLYHTNRKLPDYAQRSLADFYVRPDFYYEDGNVCVFCDGSVHDALEQQAEDRRARAALEDAGYRVVVIRYDQELEKQIERYRDVLDSTSEE